MSVVVIGVNEDASLSPEAAAVLSGASLVVGGARHLSLAAALIRGETLAWPNPMEAAIPHIRAHPGPVAVLATGDPLWFGAATLLLRHLPAGTVQVIPAPSSFQLAAARLGWALQDTACLSCCGRPVAAIIPHLQPGARLLVLSADGKTPGEIEALLHARGVAHSMIVLEALGGQAERVGPRQDTVAALNMVALEIEGPVAATLPLVAGRADDWFGHDGQITKSEVRAITLAALAPRRGELLWDVGAGSGSIGIEWMLAHPANRAIGIERRAERAARALRNAAALGVPALRMIEAAAPEGLVDLPAPDAVFLGGGAQTEGVIEAARAALRPGGRLVANAIALETEGALIAARRRYGGTLTRIGVERLDRVGRMDAYRPAMTVTQWRLET